MQVGSERTCRGLRVPILMGIAFAAALSGAALKTHGQSAAVTPAQRGRELILQYRFLPPDFSQQVLDEVWQDWPEPWRERARLANAEQRRQLLFDRYGWTPHPHDPTRPAQYVRDAQGWYAMNCFACHGGQVEGQWIEGAPNSNIALETMYEDLRRTKLRLEVPFSQMDLGSLAVPMGTTDGTSNAVVFGVALMAFRDPELDVLPFRIPRRLVHHDMDAPPWWNVYKRTRLYIDGFVEKNPRALVPFVMDQRNSGKTMRGWESKFRDILAYLQALRPPRFPHPIDPAQAREGEAVFRRHCAECHGTYGERPTYPARIVPLQTVGTDPVRLSALAPEDRRRYHESWFAHFGQDDTVIEPRGYQAPPLDGIWASAPYFHNGSVPTLWHVLHPESRPTVWRRTPTGYDRERVGLEVEALNELPSGKLRSDEARKFFDTRKPGKSAAGHPFAEQLSEKERQVLLEYLKSI